MFSLALGVRFVPNKCVLSSFSFGENSVGTFPKSDSLSCDLLDKTGPKIQDEMTWVCLNLQAAVGCLLCFV